MGRWSGTTSQGSDNPLDQEVAECAEVASGTHGREFWLARTSKPEWPPTFHANPVWLDKTGGVAADGYFGAAAATCWVCGGITRVTLSSSNSTLMSPFFPAYTTVFVRGPEVTS